MQTVFHAAPAATRPHQRHAAGFARPAAPLRLEAELGRFARRPARGAAPALSGFRRRRRARLSPPPGTPPGHDADRFDAFCAHLLVRAIATGEDSGEVVGTYRVLTPDAARRAGGFYGETEFDLAPLAPLAHAWPSSVAPAFIPPAHRRHDLALWSALGEFMVLHRLDVAFGCASVALRDGGHVRRQPLAASCRGASRAGRAEGPAAAAAGARGPAQRPRVETPPLICGYLRCGAELLGPPARDPEFGTADLPMLMALDGLPRRHRRHFLGRADA